LRSGDIAEAREWYEARRSGLGEELLLSIEEALDRIREMPEGPAKVFQNIRRAFVRT
jgi:hypothetical protein